MIVRLFCLFMSVALAYSCSPISRRALHKMMKGTEEKFQDHTGLVVYDLGAQKDVYTYRGSTYFTPASNTKIFTLFAGLNIIGDSIPAIQYEVRGDSMILWGTGDPSFLYNKVNGQGKVFSWLQNRTQSLYFSEANFMTPHFGPGWAWDDYNDYYSAERSALPIYGNAFSFSAYPGAIQTHPTSLMRHLTIGTRETKPAVIRNRESNAFTFFPSDAGKYNKLIPLHITRDVVCELLSDTLKKNVQPAQVPLSAGAKVVYSVPADSLYKVMMQDSDNFIAEQLLLLCAGIISDTLKPEIAIQFLKQGPLKDLVDEPVWVDGSGLSRYNLFTPRSIVQLWNKIYKMVPRDRLFALLATGGKAGTIKNWYGGQTPYIFGKTGTLSNNHCLSGFLVTRKGKTLVFSFMNSNFTTSTNDVRNNMQSILNLLYEKY